jgi:hypothetical protein
MDQGPSSVGQFSWARRHRPALPLKKFATARAIQTEGCMGRLREILLKWIKKDEQNETKISLMMNFHKYLLKVLPRKD